MSFVLETNEFLLVLYSIGYQLVIHCQKYFLECNFFGWKWEHPPFTLILIVHNNRLQYFMHILLELKETDLFIYSGISTILIRWGLTRYWDQQCEGLG